MTTTEASSTRVTADQIRRRAARAQQGEASLDAQERRVLEISLIVASGQLQGYRLVADFIAAALRGSSVLEVNVPRTKVAAVEPNFDMNSPPTKYGSVEAARFILAYLTPRGCTATFTAAKKEASSENERRCLVRMEGEIINPDAAIQLKDERWLWGQRSELKGIQHVTPVLYALWTRVHEIWRQGNDGMSTPWPLPVINAKDEAAVLLARHSPRSRHRASAMAVQYFAERGFKVELGKVGGQPVIILEWKAEGVDG